MTRRLNTDAYADINAGSEEDWLPLSRGTATIAFKSSFPIGVLSADLIFVQRRHAAALYTLERIARPKSIRPSTFPPWTGEAPHPLEPHHIRYKALREQHIREWGKWT